MKSSSDTIWIFFNQYTFIQVRCVHSSTYVTATVSIVSEVRVFIGEGTLSLPHTTVPFDSSEPATFRFVAQRLNHCAIAIHKLLGRAIKSRRMRWEEHAARMAGNNSYKLLVGKP